MRESTRRNKSGQARVCSGNGVAKGFHGLACCLSRAAKACLSVRRACRHCLLHCTSLRTVQPLHLPLFTSALRASSGSPRAKYGRRTSGSSVPGADALPGCPRVGDAGNLSVQACLALLVVLALRCTLPAAGCLARDPRRHGYRALVLNQNLILTQALARNTGFVSRPCLNRRKNQGSACPSRNTPINECRS